MYNLMVLGSGPRLKLLALVFTKMVPHLPGQLSVPCFCLLYLYFARLHTWIPHSLIWLFFFFWWQCIWGWLHPPTLLTFHVIVIYCCITNYHQNLVAYSNKYLLSYNFCRSRTCLWLNCVSSHELTVNLSASTVVSSEGFFFLIN